MCQRKPRDPHRTAMTISAVFCPYCLAVMTRNAETNSYLCDGCGHIAVPDKLDEICPCAKCAASSGRLANLTGLSCAHDLACSFYLCGDSDPSDGWRFAASLAIPFLLSSLQFRSGISFSLKREDCCPHKRECPHQKLPMITQTFVHIGL